MNEKRKIRVALVSLPVNEYRFSIIGPLVLATHIKENMKNVEIRIIDNAFENVEEKIDKFRPDIIGLSTFTSYYQTSIDFAKRMKLKYPGTKIIVGGPHITTLPESFNRVFDFGIMGEGENALVQLLDSIIKNKDFKKIKGLVYYDKNKIVINKRRDLGELKYKIDYDFMNKNYFKKRFIPELGKFGVTVGMMTSLGCPFNCRFCSIRACWNKIRYRKIEEVVDEIKDLYDNFNVRHIDFYDDLFSVNKKRLEEFYQELKKRGLLGKITFGCQVRTNMMDDEMCSLLKKINLKTVMFGFESGSDRVLQYIKNDPTLTVEKHRKAIDFCKKHGLNVYGSLMIGIPGEKLEDMQKTIDFIDYGIKKRVGRLWAQVLVPMPATEMWEIAKKRGKINESFFGGEVNMHNREMPLLLDPDVKYEDFLKKYETATKKCRIFIYRIMIKTFMKNPLSIFDFMKDTPFYLKRTINFITGAPID